MGEGGPEPGVEGGVDAVVGSGDGGEVLGLTELYGELGWTYHCLNYFQNTLRRTAVFCNPLLHCCRQAGSGSAL